MTTIKLIALVSLAIAGFLWIVYTSPAMASEWKVYDRQPMKFEDCIRVGRYQQMLDSMVRNDFGEWKVVCRDGFHILLERRNFA